jgi:phage-related tail protein
MGQWNTRALAGSNAAIAYEAAIDDATKAVKDNGKTLDINTEKGRANRTALNNIAAAANAQTKAMDDAGASNVAVAKKAETSRAAFIKVARQMGLSKTAAEALATSLINIPNVSREAKLTANKKDLDAKLAAAKRELANPNLTKERKAQIRANIAQLQAALRAARAALASLPSSKTVTVHSRFITERIIRTQTTAVTGGHAPTHAAGGVASGWSWVGERGPELAHFSSPTQIIPAHQSRRMAGGAAQINLSVSAPGNAAEAFIVEMLRRFVKVNGGGNVQQALGRT